MFCLNACKKDSLSNDAIFYRQLLHVLANNASIETQNEDLLLNEHITLHSETGYDISWKDLTTKTKIVFYFSENNCDACVLKIFEQLSNQNMLDNNLLVVAAYKKDKLLKLFKKTNHINTPVYRIISGNLGLPIEQKDIPFLFIMDNDRTSKLLFIPEKSYPTLTDEYLKTVKKRFFSLLENNDNLGIMHIEQPKYEFGTIEQGSNAIAVFEIKNNENKPIVINSIESACDCTIPQWKRESINVGETTIVKVKYDTKKIGKFTKKIFVHSNAVNTTLVLTISGEVIYKTRQKTNATRVNSSE